MPDSQAPRARTARPLPATIPPPIRLVRAFAESVEAAPPAADLADETYLVEGLALAASASFAALSQFADLRFAAAYSENPPADAGDEQAILDGYDAWLDGAQPLLERIDGVKRKGYESALFDRFHADYQAALTAWHDAGARRMLEQNALTNDQLAALATKLKPGATSP